MQVIYGISKGPVIPGVGSSSGCVCALGRWSTRLLDVFFFHPDHLSPWRYKQSEPSQAPSLVKEDSCKVVSTKAD